MQKMRELALTFPAPKPPATLGWQHVIDLHECETPDIDDLSWVRAAMLEAAARAEATIVGERFHRFEPHGISGVVMIGESHIAVHIWPERKFAAVDVFTCNAALKTSAAAEFLTIAFGAARTRTTCFTRGEEASGYALEEPATQDTFAAVREHMTDDVDELYIDSDTETGGHWFIRRSAIAQKQTPFQKAEIIELAAFGRTLVLDGEMQSAESDEYMYHEALVHPAMCLHESPRRVLIIGGGEGAAAREVLKHRAVEQVVMVDIDSEVIALAREHLESWHRGAFDDSRLQLIVGDGYSFVNACEARFDVVIIDLVSALDGGPAEALYTQKFYEALKRRLSPGGMLVIQGMECHIGTSRDHRRVRENLHGLFAHLRSYAMFVPSYVSPWGFVIASDARDPAAASRQEIDQAIAERELALRFYDGRTHQGLFSLPKDLRAVLGES